MKACAQAEVAYQAEAGALRGLAAAVLYLAVAALVVQVHPSQMNHCVLESTVACPGSVVVWLQ